MTVPDVRKDGTCLGLVCIRLARQSDASQIDSLLLELVRFSKKARIGEIRKAIREKGIVVATINNGKRAIKGRRERIIGFIHGVIHNDPISAGPLLYITAFFVAPSFRGRGVGSRLLGSIVANSVKGSSIEGVEVATASKRALDLYTRFGFQQFRRDFGERLLGLDMKDWKRRRIPWLKQ